MICISSDAEPHRLVHNSRHGEIIFNSSRLATYLPFVFGSELHLCSLQMVFHEDGLLFVAELLRVSKIFLSSPYGVGPLAEQM